MAWPARLGGYDVVRPLSTGGMGAVLLAEKRFGEGASTGSGFKKQVAIKVVLPHLLGDDDARSLFFDEARLAARFVHPNLVHVHDFGEEQGLFYLVMEYVDGRSVLDLLRAAGGPVDDHLAARVIADAARGLAWAHALTDDDGRSLAVVHRDVSPDNLFIARVGAVKVIDFGIAKSRHRTSVSVVGLVRGKPPYMSPEHVRGDLVDARGDAWSLGVVLHELLSGRRLFRGEGHAVLQAVADGPIAPLPKRVAPELAAVVWGLLVRDPKKRLRAGEAAAALDAFLSARGVPLTPEVLKNAVSQQIAGFFDVGTGPSAADVVTDAGRPEGVATAAFVPVEEAAPPVPAPVSAPVPGPVSAAPSASTSAPPPAPAPRSTPPPATVVVRGPVATITVPLSPLHDRRSAIFAVVFVAAAVAVVAVAFAFAGGPVARVVVDAGSSAVAVGDADAGAPVAARDAAPDAARDAAVDAAPDAGAAADARDAADAARDAGAAADAARDAGVAATADAGALRRPERRRPPEKAEKTEKEKAEKREPAGLYVPDRTPYVDVVIDGKKVGVSPLGTARKPHLVPPGAHTVVLVEPQTGAVVLTRKLQLAPGEIVGVREGR